MGKFSSAFLFVLSLIATNLFSQTEPKPLAAYKIDSLWHVVDYSGKDILKPFKAENVSAYSEGAFLFSVLKDGAEKQGFMNLKGEVIIPPIYDKALPFSEGYCLVMKSVPNSKVAVEVYFLDKKGKPLNKKPFIDGVSFSEGLAYFMDADRNSGYIDSTGARVLDLQGNIGNEFSEGLAAASRSGFSLGFIDKTGRFVVQPRFDMAGKFSEGKCAVFYDAKYGYIDKTGKTILQYNYDYARPFKSGRAWVGNLERKKMKIRWAIIDSAGNALTPYSFIRVSNFSEGYAAVRDSLGWGFVDRNGVFLFKKRFFHTANFIDGLAWASEKNGKRGFINTKGEYVVELPKFDKAYDLRLNKRIY